MTQLTHLSLANGVGETHVALKLRQLRCAEEGKDISPIRSRQSLRRKTSIPPEKGGILCLSSSVRMRANSNEHADAFGFEQYRRVRSDQRDRKQRFIPTSAFATKE